MLWMEVVDGLRLWRLPGEVGGVEKTLPPSESSEMRMRVGDEGSGLFGGGLLSLELDTDVCGSGIYSISERWSGRRSWVSFNPAETGFFRASENRGGVKVTRTL